jgi:hypothetical protein
MNKKKDKEIRRMLEAYTMVPPFPGIIRKKRRHHGKKVSKISTKR